MTELRAGKGVFALPLAVLLLLAQTLVAAAVDVRVAVLRVDGGAELPLSRLDLPPDDLGFAGAQLSTRDNLTTGRFLGHDYETLEVQTTPETMLAEVDGLIDTGVSLFVVLAGAEALTRISDHVEGREVLLFNAAAADDSLRNDACAANTLHVVPSHAMRADGLAQFLVWKKWREWFVVHGSHPADDAWLAAIRRAAKRFGAKIVEEREFEDTGGARRTDTGHVQVQKQMPVFTQRVKDHDVLIAADESEVFAGYLPYQTWEPRPVAGSAGLRPVGWHPALEAWGATQFQRRFERATGRRMRDEDYATWLALRVVGEAVTRTASADPGTLREYIRSDDFELAAFMGVPVDFRRWNNQLRLPILLVHDRMLVSVSPQDEFLHKVSRLDTLGYDEPESGCTIND